MAERDLSPEGTLYQQQPPGSQIMNIYGNNTDLLMTSFGLNITNMLSFLRPTDCELMAFVLPYRAIPTIRISSSNCAHFGATW